MALNIGKTWVCEWSPDGTRIALFKHLHGWTRDGRSIICPRLDPETQWDLWVLPLDGDRTPRACRKTRFNESNGSVSPDGRWIAYLPDESGRMEA